jgi:hypothetical protein
MKTRADLDAQLFQVSAALPLWRRVLASEDAFQAQCESLASRVLDGTHPGDREYAKAQLQRTFERHRRTAESFEGAR